MHYLGSHVRGILLFLILTSEEDVKRPSDTVPPAEIPVKAADHDDFAVRKARANKKAGSPKQKFVHFGPVTEIDQQKWDKLVIGRVSSKNRTEEESKKYGAESHSGVESSPSNTVGSLEFVEHSDEISKPQNELRYLVWLMKRC